jgi:translation initiation factor 1 (eIF-1/SUI1)
MCTSLVTHSACCAQISLHPFASLARKIHMNSSRSSQKFSSSLVVNEKERRTRRPTVSRTPSSRVSLMCRAAKDNNNNNKNENPFAALQSMRGTLVDKPELAVKKEVKRTSTNIDEFAYEEENKTTKKAPTKKKAMPPAPSRNGKGGVRIKVERRKNKVVTVVTGLENPTKELVTKLKKVLGAGASLDADTCIFQGTHANALEDMIKAMGYKDVKIVK